MNELPFFGKVNSTGAGGAISRAPTQAFSALSQMGQGISNAGNNIGKIYAQQKSLEELEAVQNAREDMRVMHKEQELFMQKNLDENTWGPEWEKKLQGFQKKHAQREFINPDRMMQYQTLHGEAKRTFLDLQVKAHHQKEKRTQMHMSNTVGALQEAGDYEGADKIITTDGAAAGLYPEQIAALKQANKSKQSQSAAKAKEEKYKTLAMRGDITAIEESDLSDYDKERLLVTANAKQSRMHRTAVENVMTKAEVEGIRTEEGVIKAIEDEENFPDPLKEQVLFHWKQSQPLDLETKTITTERIDDLVTARRNGEVQPEQYEVMHDQIAQEVFAMGSRQGSGPLRKRIYETDPANWKEENLQQEQSPAAMEQVRKWAKIYADKGQFGKDETGPQALDVEQKKEAVIKEMEEWINSNSEKMDPTTFEKELNRKFRDVSMRSLTDNLFEPEPIKSRSDKLNSHLGKPSAPKPAEAKSTTFHKSKTRPFRVFTGSRDDLKKKTGSFSSSMGSRMIALDFNDASNKSARGIEIVSPRGASAQEIQALKNYASATQEFFKSKGIDIPLRGDEGIAMKSNGQRRHGKSGVIHTEPFFASNTAAREAIMNDPQGYAEVLASTLGSLHGSTFIAPHTRFGANDSNPGPGMTSGSYSERDFAMQYILPYLSKI